MASMLCRDDLEQQQQQQESRVLEKVVVESEKKLQRRVKQGRNVEEGLCFSIRQGRVRLALVAREDDERARFHLKAAWAADYTRLEPYVSLAKKAAKEKQLQQQQVEEPAESRGAASSSSRKTANDVGELALASLAYFEPLVAQFPGRASKHQLMMTCGDLERYRSTLGNNSDLNSEDNSSPRKAERWYLRAALTKPGDGRAFGMLAMVARGDSPAATHWAYRAELAETEWDGARQVFQFHGERCKRKADEDAAADERRLSFEWHAAAALVLAKTRVSGAGGMLGTARRRFEHAQNALPNSSMMKGRAGHDEEGPSRLEALRWILTTIFARLAASEREEEGVADVTTRAFSLLLGYCCVADSTSAVLAGARYIAVLDDFSYHNDVLAKRFADAANRAVATLRLEAAAETEHSQQKNAVALDDDAYCAGLYDAPAEADDFVDDDIERAKRLRDVALVLCERKRLVSVRREKGTDLPFFEPIVLHRRKKKRNRGRRERRTKDESPSFARRPQDDHDGHAESRDDYDGGEEVPSGASDSGSDDDDGGHDDDGDHDEGDVARSVSEVETDDDDDDADADSGDDDDDDSHDSDADSEAESDSEDSEETLFVVDAANVAMRYGSSQRAFRTQGIRLCLEYLERKYRRCKFAIFLPDYVLSPKIVASNQRRRDRARLTGDDVDDFSKKIPDDLPYLLDLQRRGILHATPSQDYDDSYQIDYARRHDGTIVSNDRFRDAITKAPPDKRDDLASFLDSRILSFAFVGGDEFVPNPDFRLPVRLKKTPTSKKKKKRAQQRGTLTTTRRRRAAA